MQTLSSQAPEEKMLIESIAFFRRMGNYLFLPVFIVFAFCTAIMLGADFGDRTTLFASTFFRVNFILMVAGFVFWRLSRRPRPTMLLSVGLLLAGIDIVWVGWLIYLLGTGGWKTVVFRSEYALAVLIGIGGAAAKCFQYWNVLRRIDAAILNDAVRTVLKRK
jgi:hypothetical protein